MTQDKNFFGTDGIRGRANTFPMTAKMAMKVAMATAITLREQNSQDWKKGHQNRVVIGKDTRLSGYMIEQAMAAGFVSMGIDVVFLGPLPTPAVSMLTRSLRADVGVMISASHNPYEDNGIKLFGADGFKLSDDVERIIEERIDQNLDEHLIAPDRMGKASRLDDAQGRYIEFIKSSIPNRQTLEGLKIVIDCAHGAAYKVAPKILWELEAEVVSIGVEPNGTNINDGVGATATKSLQDKVLAEKADIGVALDGDADRLIMVDEKGQIIDGDQLLALLAIAMQENDGLAEHAVVATVMSNLGLERFLEQNDIDLIRTGVGDRYVMETMRAGGFNLGGEQSGHIILSDFSRTGDGLLAALQVLLYLKAQSVPASACLQMFTAVPQLLKNVRYDKSVNIMNHEDILSAIDAAQARLANDGRLLVRPSGTEPVIRVMAEGDDDALVQSVVNDLCETIQKYGKAV